MKNIASRVLRKVSIILSLVPLCSCQQHPGEGPRGDPLVLSGLWYNGPETSQFLPCEMYEPGQGGEWIMYGSGYWLDSYQDESAEFVEQVEEQSDVDVGYDTVVYVSIEARLSEVGRYGHMGQYEREIIPIKLIDIGGTEVCPDAGE